MNSNTNHQEQLEMSDHATADTEADQLQRRIRQAISDPGSILPRTKIPYLDDEPESITSWGARAVMTVIGELQTQRAAAVELLQKAAGGPTWPMDDDDVLAGLVAELDQIPNGGAQAGEEAPETGTSELDRLRQLQFTTAQLLGIAHQPDGTRPERIAAVLSEMVAMAGSYSMAVEQRDDLAAGMTRVQQQIEHLPCVSPRCPEALCSLCSAKISLRDLLADVETRAAVDEIPAREIEVDVDGPWYVRILDEPTHHTTVDAPVRIDWTSDGTMIGIEVLDAGELREEPS